MINAFLDNIADFINDKVIFITGGTGSFGNEMTKILLENFNPKKIIIFSRDEYKQFVMKQKFPESKYKCMRYFVGDVRDYDRLLMATKDVDILFHAAAMKQVDTIEYNPFEAIKTNIYGTENVVKAAINNHIKKVVGVSTDKCVAPLNLYGATKLCLEKIIIYGNMMSGHNGPIFSVLRYGNVFGSRGSVVPLFISQAQSINEFTITDKNMTRFTLTLKEAITFVINCAFIMRGGEVFIPKIPSYNIVQLAKCINPDCLIKIVGKRPGEKIYESMIASNESYRTLEQDGYYVILPEINIVKDYSIYEQKQMGDDKEYSSNNNILIDDDKLIKLINEYK